jgi:rod shape determining protein RodA
MFSNYKLIDVEKFQKNFLSIDWSLFFAFFLISIIGIAFQYSAAGGNFNYYVTSQVYRFILFLPIMIIIICLVDLKYIYRYAYLFYALAIILLLVALFSGKTIMGAKRWINIAGFTIQPSEVIKICLIIALSRYFHNLNISRINKLLYLIFPILLSIIPIILILIQPDLGTAFILTCCALTIFFITGINSTYFIISFILAISSIPLIWNFLKEYQQERVLTFINPDRNPLGAGYNITQSKIAAGSGGLFGKGFLSGSQGQLNFLPERKTDFIFVIISEELGFIGSFCVICIYCFIFYKIYRIANNCRCYFSKLLATGLNSFLFLHFFINIAMAIGLIPVVGAPLPMISYGGTMLVITMLSFAIIFNLDINKNKSLSRFDPNF